MRRLLSRAIMAALFCCLSLSANAAKNVILMIGDGMGSEHVKAGSYYLTGTADGLSFQPYYRCSVTTRSLNAEVTDSAASATTMATGHKTNNGVLSQSPDGVEYETILEYAKRLGKRTALVTTVPITHATPAAFAAHEPSRNNYINIGNDYLDSSQPDLIFGGGDPDRGGAGYFSSEQVAKAEALGYHVVRDITWMNGLHTRGARRAIGLFNGGTLTREANRRFLCKEPRLSQMTARVLSLLDRSPDGFFVMIEGGMIDSGGHESNAAVVATETAEFGRAAAVVLKWMRSHPDTLLIVTADHETGGMSTSPCRKGGIPEAKWTSNGGHTATNVPLYATGKDTDLVSGYIKNGVIDDTDIYRIMKAAMDRGPSGKT